MWFRKQKDKQNMSIQPSKYQKIPQAVYKGSFSQTNHISWVSCREVWSGYFTSKMEEFLFTHKPWAGEKIAEFFELVEKRLKLKKNHTFFETTNLHNVILVKPSGWWRKYRIRRELFTVLLRSAQNYTGNPADFEKALFSYDYAKQTKPAVEKFMEGFTLMKKSAIRNGWRDTFFKRPDASKDLIKPPAKKIAEAIEGIVDTAKKVINC